MSFISLPASVAGKFPAIRRPWDSRAIRVGTLLSVVLLLNIMDVAYTVFANRIGMLNEMNPIAESFLKADLLPSLLCFKALMLISGLGMIWKSRRSRLALPACWTLVTAYAALGVIWYLWAQTVASQGVFIASAGQN